MRPPTWVRWLYAIIAFVDNYPIYFLPSCVRYWRYKLWDDGCGCDNCEDRRKKGRQGPRRWK